MMNGAGPFDPGVRQSVDRPWHRERASGRYVIFDGNREPGAAVRAGIAVYTSSPKLPAHA